MLQISASIIDAVTYSKYRSKQSYAAIFYNSLVLAGEIKMYTKGYKIAFTKK